MLSLSKNTLLVHIPQHLLFGVGIAACIVGAASWWWLAFTYLSWIVLGWFGFSVWYHRYFAHRAFKTYRVWELVWGYLGLLVGRGSPINMASLHCGEHHPNADRPGDPHSPLDGALHSWVMWAESHTFKLSRRAAKHLVGDRFIRFLDKHYLTVFWLTFAVLLVIDWRIALFGMMGAGAVHYHIEGAVSTLCHLPAFGRQDFPTGDRSRNIRGVFNWILLGTGLHNNHHYRPSAYHYALLPGDFDPARWLVKPFIRHA